MPAWLVEGDPFVYALLASAMAVLLVVWWRTRKRQYAVAAGAMAALIVGYFLLEQFIESDGKQMVRKVREVAAAVSANNLDAAFRNVSDNFDRGGMKKEQFRQFCNGVRASGKVSEVKTWGEEAMEISRPAGTGTVAFRFKVTGSWGETPPNHFARVLFTLDPDGQWRVKSFDVYDSLNQSKTPIAIPGLGGR
jgi:hypothetical protein